MDITSKLKIFFTWIFYILLIFFPITILFLILCKNTNTSEIIGYYIGILGLLFGLKEHYESKIASVELNELREKNIKLKEMELELSQRPELIIDEIIKHIPEPNNELTYSLKCKNNGRSNAKVIIYEFKIYKNDTSQGPYIIDDYISNIPPNKESVTLSPRIHEKVFSDDFFKTGSIKILVKINYQDPINKTHQTEAQFEYDNQRDKYRLLNIKFHFDI